MRASKSGRLAKGLTESWLRYTGSESFYAPVAFFAIRSRKESSLPSASSTSSSQHRKHFLISLSHIPLTRVISGGWQCIQPCEQWWRNRNQFPTTSSRSCMYEQKSTRLYISALRRGSVIILSPDFPLKKHRMSCRLRVLRVWRPTRDSPGSSQ